MKDPKTINVKIVESKDYKKIPATGVYGGPTPTGELCCNFFIEYRALPNEVKIKISNTEGITEESEINENLYIRELLIGIVMTPMVAKSIGQWMINKADEIINLSKK